jgi:hypothetical protein
MILHTRAVSWRMATFFTDLLHFAVVNNSTQDKIIFPQKIKNSYELCTIMPYSRTYVRVNYINSKRKSTIIQYRTFLNRYNNARYSMKNVNPLFARLTGKFKVKKFKSNAILI